MWQLDIDNYKRFKNEIALLKKAEHPRLIRCLDDGVIQAGEIKVPFYVMPLAKGSARDLFDKNRFKNLKFAHRFFQELGLALQYLHKKGCFHRDLKPQNILLEDNDLPLVADLGIAHINPEFTVTSVHTNPEDKLHNLGYFAPEQRYGGDAKKVDHRADICSFGYLLQEALTGRYPLGSNSPLPSTINSEYLSLDAVIMKCTAYEKNNRYQSMDECLYELNIAFSGSTQERNQLAAFYIASEKLKFLARHWTLTSDLLSAENLRALYLNRFKFKPINNERTVIFHNLLLRGQQKHHHGRSKNLPTGLSDAAPGSLGWYWFRNITKENSLELIRQAAFHRHNFIRSGAARALGRLGTIQDKVILRDMIKDHDANVVKDALQALAQIDTDEDIDLIRKYQDDQRDRVREAVAEVLGKHGSYKDINIILKLIRDNNVAVKRVAVTALGFIATPEKAIYELKSILKEVLKDSNDQVRKAAEKTLKRLNNEPFDPVDSHERSVKRITNREDLNDTNQEARNKAYSFLRSKDPRYQDVGIRWIIKHETNKIDTIIENHGFKLPDRVLQQLDYYIYCPQWWRDAMDGCTD